MFGVAIFTTACGCAVLIVVCCYLLIAYLLLVCLLVGVDCFVLCLLIAWFGWFAVGCVWFVVDMFFVGVVGY